MFFSFGMNSQKFDLNANLGTEYKTHKIRSQHYFAPFESRELEARPGLKGWVFSFRINALPDMLKLNTALGKLCGITAI